KMLSLSSGQVDKSFQVLLNSDTDMIAQIKHDENRVDKLDIKIDKLCQRIFALAQPVAGDLRFIMASLRIGNEMERISDMAFEITKRSESVSQYPEILSQYEIPGLLDQIRKLFIQLNEAFSNNNAMLAYDIIARCKEREEDCESIFREVVSQMTKKSNVIIIATDLILIIRNLERIIGHVENIAESIIFIVDAKIVRHPKLSADKQKEEPGQNNGAGEGFSSE
ncbi:MAG: phosphate signaling complex protein PhoU, partial [Bacteroidales bacterium]|nr:phosphate signaling complex protein PhoU [Bacteroidales bacterium]